MREINPNLLAYIQQEILPQYDAVDGAHGPEHIRRVISNSLELAQQLDVDINMVYTIAACHDLGIRYGRENHERTSAELLIEDQKLEQWFTPEQREIMKQAVEDHRASRSEAPRSLYGRIVSEADRDIDPEEIVKRCVEYGKAHAPELTRQEQLNRAEEHIRQKYGEDGYLHLWLPCSRNEQGLSTLREWLRTGILKQKAEKYL